VFMILVLLRLISMSKNVSDDEVAISAMNVLF